MKKQLRYALLDQGIFSGSAFLSGVLIARMMGPDAFGGYTLANGIFVILVGLQQALLLAPLIVFGASTTEETGPYLYATRVIHHVVAGVCAILMAAVATMFFVFDSDVNITAALFGTAALVFFALVYDFWRQVVIAKRELRNLLTCDFASKMLLISMLVVFYLSEEQHPFLFVYSSLVVSALIGAVAAWNFGRRHLVATHDYRKYWGKNWSFGKWSGLNQIIITATSQIPLYVLVSLHGTAQTGILGAAIQLTGVFHVFLSGIMNYCFPVAVLINEQERRSALTRYTKKLIFYLLAPISFICLIVIIETKEIVQFLYTDSFSSQGLWPFRILLLVGPILAVIRPLDMMLRVRSQMKRRSSASLIELLFVAIAIYPAVSFFGALGAAYILVLGRMVSAFVLAFVIWFPEINSSKLD